jgi:hypothetical protein
MYEKVSKKLDGNIIVYVFVYLRSGQCITAKSTAKTARECIDHWHKYIKFLILGEDERKKIAPEDSPWSIYFFMDGRPQTEDEPLPKKTMFLMQDVIGMTYDPVPEEDERGKDLLKTQGEMFDAMKAYFKNELKSDAWKNDNCDGDHK